MTSSPPLAPPRPCHRIFASGNHAGRCLWLTGFLGDLPFPTPLHSGAAPISLQSPSSALKTAMTRSKVLSPSCPDPRSPGSLILVPCLTHGHWSWSHVSLGVIDLGEGQKSCVKRQVSSGNGHWSPRWPPGRRNDREGGAPISDASDSGAPVPRALPPQPAMSYYLSQNQLRLLRTTKFDGANTADFRNAFLKTIRQIIRESVRNMSIPATKLVGSGTVILTSPASTSSTGVAPASSSSPAATSATAATSTEPAAGRSVLIVQGSHTLGKTKKPLKGPQRHSAGNIDYDNAASSSRESDDPNDAPPTAFRSRSKTVSDGIGTPLARRTGFMPGSHSSDKSGTSPMKDPFKGQRGENCRSISSVFIFDLATQNSATSARLLSDSRAYSQHAPNVPQPIEIGKRPYSVFKCNFSWNLFAKFHYRYPHLKVPNHLELFSWFCAARRRSDKGDAMQPRGSSTPSPLSAGIYTDVQCSCRTAYAYETARHEMNAVEKGRSECDPGTKSEGEEESQPCTTVTSKSKASLGRTPNHLSLSTTSTLSAGSTGSQARLIQSSHQPENYQPLVSKDLGELPCPSQASSGELEREKQTIPEKIHVRKSREGPRLGKNPVRLGSRRTLLQLPISLLASHHGEPGSISGRSTPGFSRLGIVPDDGAGESGISLPPPRPYIPAFAPYLPQSPTSALETSLLRAAQISSLFTEVEDVVVPLLLPCQFFDWLHVGLPATKAIQQSVRYTLISKSDSSLDPPRGGFSPLALPHVTGVRSRSAAAALCAVSDPERGEG
ncbi:hypothetical protein PR048_013731 [Dryococelus australis]|uniref:Uncharacterized protein n=1 Tax=Dryococelus australis TaxID=614101 RepID=A0ABQ9HTT9_9NEOP|nr:hypothetical protein PR048_013731 [Dryococelus australis]